MLHKFISRKFSVEAEGMLAHISGILEDYESQGYDLSLRQLYYQLVAKDLIPHERSYYLSNGKWIAAPYGVNGASPNAEPNYKWIGDIVTDARLAGRIDWDMIKDRGREMVQNNHWNNPAEILRASAEQYQIDKWAPQPNYVELMVEKQALEGVLGPVCREMDIPFTANKGYSSSSAMYEAGQRFNAKLDEGKSVHVIYLGDHDPSGIDMTRDIDERLQMFAEAHNFSDVSITVHRIALNMPQIKTLRPPENPAKITDSRAASYISKFGRSSWELDAIEPRKLADLVRTQVLNLRDEDLWVKAVKREDGMRRELHKFAKQSKFSE